jgi:hypothetical protein
MALMRQLFGLEYDYIEQQGHYIVFYRESGLHSTDLAELQVKMLQFNSIPRLVPIEIEEQDLNVKLRFQISSKRLLSHFLKAQKLNIEEYYLLLLRVVSIIEDSKNYMLKEEGFIVDEEYIYLGSDLNDVQLIYLPLKDFPGKRIILEDVRALALSLIGSVEELKGSGIQVLMNTFKDTKLSLLEIKKVLLNLIKKNSIVDEEDKFGPQSQIPPDYTIKQDYESRDSPLGKYHNSPLDRNISTLESPPDQTIHHKSLTNKPIFKKESTNSENTQLKSLSSRSQAYLSLTAVLLVSIIWILYVEFKSEGMLYICLGLSLAVANGVYIYLKIWRPGIQRLDSGSLDSQGKMTFIESPISHQTLLSTQKTLLSTKEKSPTLVNDHTLTSNKEKAEDTEGVSKSKSPNLTTLLTNPDATVQLKKTPYAESLKEKGDIIPILEVERKGEKEVVKLTSKSFVIGRNPVMASYVDASPGVSRAHVEIVVEGVEGLVKDLSSSNGTLLNKEQLIPNKLYQLKEGDVLEISNSKYTYKLE